MGEQMKALGQIDFRVFLVAAALGASLAAVGAAAPETERAQAREIFAHIVGIESSIGKGNVPLVARYLAERFKAGGFPDADIHILPLGETASLVVRYRGSGSGGRPIALIAHMDVVTAKRADWQRDPYHLTEEKGFFYGRGTSDVKQEVALLTATFLRLKAAGFVPTRDLIIAFSGDEETAQATARDLVTTHRDLVDAEFALNGDGGGGVLAEGTAKPLIFYVQGAEKSSAQFLLTTHNAGGHSSQPRADNAIYELADALKAVQAYEFPVMWNEWTLGDFKAASRVTQGPDGEAMARFAADPHDAAAAAADRKEPGAGRATPHDLRGDHAERRPCGKRAAAVGDRDHQLPDLSRHQRRGRAEDLAGIGGPQGRGETGLRRPGVGCFADACGLDEGRCQGGRGRGSGRARGADSGVLCHGRCRVPQRRNPHLRGGRRIHHGKRGVCAWPQRANPGQ
jgi:hypothetical protein